MKATIASLILIVVIILAFSVPWYSVTSPEQILQTGTYTTNTTSSYATSTVLMTIGFRTLIDYSMPFGQPETVYTLSSPVTLSGQYATWISPSFYLQSGMAVKVTAALCEDCSIAIMPANDSAIALQGWLNGSIIYYFNSYPPNLNMNVGSVVGLVIESGSYIVSLSDREMAGTVTSVSVVQMSASLQTTVVTSQIIKTETVFATMNSTEYSTSNATVYVQSMNPPYAILGWGTSAAIVLVVIIIAAFAIAFDRGLISPSTRKRRKRTRRR